MANPIIVECYVLYSHTNHQWTLTSRLTNQIISIAPPCFGSHSCDRTNFLPQLVFNINNTPETLIINASNAIDVNNGSSETTSNEPLPDSPTYDPRYDRLDYCTFTIMPTADVLTNASIKLNCLLGNNCHNSVTSVILLLNGNVIFNACVNPDGDPVLLPINPAEEATVKREIHLSCCCPSLVSPTPTSSRIPITTPTNTNTPTITRTVSATLNTTTPTPTTTPTITRSPTPTPTTFSNWRILDRSYGGNAITISDNGLKIATTVEGGYIYTSNDGGSTWTPNSNAGIGPWIDIAGSSDGVKLAAVYGNFGGYIYTSNDSGISWVQRNPDTSITPRWTRVVSSKDGIKLFAIESNYGYIYKSNNAGNTWVKQIAAGQRNWTDIACSSDGTKLVASIYNGKIWSSTNEGASWTETTSGSYQWRDLFISDNNLIIGITLSNSAIISSNGGASYASYSLPNNTLKIAGSIDGNKLAVVTAYNNVHFSNNRGVTWIKQTQSPSIAAALASSTNGSAFAVCSNKVYLYTEYGFYASNSNQLLSQYDLNMDLIIDGFGNINNDGIWVRYRDADVSVLTIGVNQNNWKKIYIPQTEIFSTELDNGDTIYTPNLKKFLPNGTYEVEYSTINNTTPSTINNNSFSLNTKTHSSITEITESDITGVYDFTLEGFQVEDWDGNVTEGLSWFMSLINRTWSIPLKKPFPQQNFEKGTYTQTFNIFDGVSIKFEVFIDVRVKNVSNLYYAVFLINSSVLYNNGYTNVWSPLRPEFCYAIQSPEYINDKLTGIPMGN